MLVSTKSRFCNTILSRNVALLVKQGVNTYRFSIAWARVLPTGGVDNINQKGVEYYKDLIAKLKANNIQPLVTMHHWDHPRVIEDIGGFLNEVRSLRQL